ncbi:hypothetical protein ACOSQ2_020383 [Xanthoceras sorbifolium]
MPMNFVFMKPCSPPALETSNTEDVVVDDVDEVLVLGFDEPLCLGEGLLEIEFAGKLNEFLCGFYRCTYVDKEVEKNAAVTQFELAAARRCFPC